MRARLLVAAVLQPLLLLPACSAEPSGSDPANPDQVEVLTWMTSGTEAEALAALTAAFGEEHPRIEVLDASIADGHDAATAAIVARFEAGSPPDAVQVRAGAELRGYVLSDALTDLGPLLAEAGLDRAFPAELLAELSVAGRVYAVPAVVQRANVVWVGIDALERAGVPPRTPASDIRGWIADLTRLRDAGMAHPLALGGPQQQLALFENVLLAELGLERYRGLWNGQTRWDGDAVAQAVDTYRELLAFADPAASRAHDEDVLAAFAAGDAAYLVGPGSTDGALSAAGLAYGEQYLATPFPSSGRVFLFSVDAFALPAGPSHPDAARDWLRLVGSATGQSALAATAGAVPVRAGVPVTSAYQRSAQSSLDLRSLAPSLSLGAAAQPEWTAAIRDAVAGFRRDGRAAALLTALAAAADEALVTVEPEPEP